MNESRDKSKVFVYHMVFFYQANEKGVLCTFRVALPYILRVCDSLALWVSNFVWIFSIVTFFNFTGYWMNGWKKVSFCLISWLRKRPSNIQREFEKNNLLKNSEEVVALREGKGKRQILTICYFYGKSWLIYILHKDFHLDTSK